MGRGGGMISTGAGDFAVEEDGEGWLDTMVLSFRRMTSNLDSMEAWSQQSEVDLQRV